MKKSVIFFTIILVLSAHEVFADYEKLTKKNYNNSKNEKAVVIYGVNWGRQWGCAGFENAQLQRLTFTRIDLESGRLDQKNIVLKTFSKLLAEDRYKAYTMIIAPGEYALSGFDVKIAKSVKEVGHLKAGINELFENGKPTGGTFKVNPGEIVYIGEFGLDCVYEPIPWRYYIEEKDFERYIKGFRKEYKFVGDKQVMYRLFQTNKFGQ